MAQDTYRRSNELLKKLQSWWVPVVIVMVSCVAIIAAHAGFIGFADRPAYDLLVILVTMQLLFASWVWFLSQIRTDRQLLTIVAFVAAHAGVLQLLRLDGFTGDGRLIWTWRWIPAPQDAIDWKQRPDLFKFPTNQEAVDWTKTSPFDYPSFRGRDRTGHTTISPISKDWKINPPRLLWRRPIGVGWSSFVATGDYCVTQEQRGQQEATVCYELHTGRECWAHYEQARFYEATSGIGPRSTPTIHNGCVYSLGATGILNCLEGADGQPKWTINILEDNQASNRLFGVTGSPLVAESMVIVNPGGRGSSLAAYDLETGKRLWRAGNSGASYSSPQLAQLCNRQQVLDFNADGLFAHDLLTGEPLWNVPWISNPAERNNVCQPVVYTESREGRADCVFIASGYGMGCALFEVREHNDCFTAVELWRNRHIKAKFSSVVEHQGYVYGLDDAILTCVEISTGKRRWKGGRYGYGQLLLAESLLFVQLESGEIALVEASPDSFQEVGRFTALSARTWNHPALIDRFLLVRNDREAACYELLPLEKNAGKRTE